MVDYQVGGGFRRSTDMWEIINITERKIFIKCILSIGWIWDVGDETYISKNNDPYGKDWEFLNKYEMDQLKAELL